MALWRTEGGDWQRYRSLPGAVEVDFHREGLDGLGSYYNNMQEVFCDALHALEAAHQLGLKYVIFTHGSSTSGPGRTTARSQVRGLMRGPSATPYIKRRECIEHRTVFVAALRANPHAPALPETPACPHCAATRTKPRLPAGHFRCLGMTCEREFDWLDFASDPTPE